MFLVLDVEGFLQHLLDVVVFDLHLASVICAFQREFVLTDLSLEGLREAVLVKNVFAIF